MNRMVTTLSAAAIGFAAVLVSSPAIGHPPARGIGDAVRVTQAGDAVSAEMISDPFWWGG